MSTATALVYDHPLVRNDAVEREVDLTALYRLCRRRHDRFAFILVEYDLPRQVTWLLKSLRGTLTELNLVHVTLAPPPPDAPAALHVLDQLHDLVATATPERSPGILAISGLETLLPAHLTDEQSAVQLRRAIQPLNLGRNLLAEGFPCPVLLLLPNDAMSVFSRFAPDLSSWCSASYQFHSDVEQVRNELERAVWPRWGWMERRRLQHTPSAALYKETQRLESLIADAEALPAEDRVIAGLFQRLGESFVALGNGHEARRAYLRVSEVARRTRDGNSAKAAVRGLRAAVRAMPRRAGRDTPTLEAPRAFRGPAALSTTEPLYGRNQELGTLLSKVHDVSCRFLTVWGDAGCGKSSLIRSGLVPKLVEDGLYLPIVVESWGDAETSVHQALERASGLSLDPSEPLARKIDHVARYEEKTVVVICEQFERFFLDRPQFNQRKPFLKTIGSCVENYAVSCMFLFVLRGDELGRIAEFRDIVPEPLEERKQFQLSLFSASQAERVLRSLVQDARLGWSEIFVRGVVASLTEDGRVRPAELQMLGASLTMLGIDDDQGYILAGGREGLLNAYLSLTLHALAESRQERQLLEKVLLLFVEEPGGRCSRTLRQIAESLRLPAESVRVRLDRLEKANLVCSVKDSHGSGSTDHPATEQQYDLAHDALVDRVRLLTPPANLVLKVAKLFLSGTLDRLTRLFRLDVFGESLLSRRARVVLGSIALLLSGAFLFDLTAWTLLFNAVLHGEPLAVSWLTIPALLAGLLFAVMVLIFKRLFITTDTSRGWRRAYPAILLYTLVLVSAAIGTVQPIELLIFRGPIVHRIHEEGVRVEAARHLRALRAVQGEPARQEEGLRTINPNPDSLPDQRYDIFEQLRVLNDLRHGEPPRWKGVSEEEIAEIGDQFGLRDISEQDAIARRRAAQNAIVFNFTYFLVYFIALVIPLLVIAVKLLLSEELEAYYSISQQNASGNTEAKSYIAVMAEVGQ